MSLFNGIRNLFDDEEEEKKVRQTSSWFEPQYHTDYKENQDLYDQAHYYWTTGEFPVVQYDEKEKTGYEQNYHNEWELENFLSPSSPLYYNRYKYDAVNKSKEELEEEARNKRGTLDRIFGIITNNSITQGLYYALDDDEETTFLKGLGEGISYMNPFEDDVSNRKTFSDVIELFDDDPTDDKFGENAIEAILGFAGDVLLDPTTYLTGGLSAVSKIVKGSGAVVKGTKFAGKLGTEVVDMATGEILEGLSEQTIRNADDVANLFKSVPDGIPVVKTARDSVESAKKVEEVKKGIAQNLYKGLDGDKGVIKVMDFDTAKRYITEHASGGRYTPEEIDKMAENLTKSFNKTMFGLTTGGRDLTFFGQKLVSANTFRNIGDNTIAPYYNKLATKIRQTKIANKFGTNPYSKTAYDDFTDALRPYFNDFMLKQNKIKIAKGTKEAGDFVQENINTLSKEEQDIVLKAMDDGTFKQAKEYHECKIDIKEQALRSKKKTDPEYKRLKKEIEAEQKELEYLGHVEEYLLNKSSKAVDAKILEDINLRKMNPDEAISARITDELEHRKDEFEELLGKPFEEFTDKELTSVKQIIEFEHDSMFGIFGELSAFASTEKSLTNIIYDYITDDSVFDFAKKSNLKNTVKNMYGEEINHTEALSKAADSYKMALRAELSDLYGNKSVISGNYGKKSARQYAESLGLDAEELRSRCDVLSIFDKANTDGYYIRTYGDDVKRIRDALIREEEFIKNLDIMAKNLVAEGRPRDAVRIRGLQHIQSQRLLSVNGLLKLIKENSSDPAFYEDVKNIFESVGKFTTGSTELMDVALTENLIAGLKKKMNVGLAKSKTKSKNVDSITKMNIVNKLDVKDRVKIAKSIQQTNKTRFYSYIDSLSNEELYAKYFAPGNEATDSVREAIINYKVKNAYVMDSQGKLKLNIEDLDDFTLARMQEKIRESVERLSANLSKSETALSDMEFEWLNNIDEITDNFYMHSRRLTAKKLADIKQLTPDKQLYKVMEEFQNKMAEVAAREESLGVLSRGQIEAWQDQYVKHMLTPEAQKLYASNPEAYNRLGFYLEGESVTKRSNKSRKYKTIEEAEKALKDAFPDTPIRQFFETDLATIYCARCLESDRLVGQKENIKYILDNLTIPYDGKGSISSGRTLVMNYEELSKALSRAQGISSPVLGEKPVNIDFSVLKQFGIDPDFVTSNNPMIRISEENFEALNKYLVEAYETKNWDELLKGPKNKETTEYFKQLHNDFVRGRVGVPGYSMADDVIEIVNQNSMAQNSLSESAFWKLYDKFLSVYKMVNTIYSPAFYGNNALGNAFNSFLYSGAAAFDPRKLKIARGIASTGDPQQFLTLHGEKYSYKQLRDLCSRLGISNTSFYEHEIREDASKFANFALNKKLLELSSGIEDTQRIALFVEALDNTGDLEQAVNVVNKFLFDYSDLTDFEHKVMKRAIPFYTFMRKNAPLQLEQILTNPHKYRNLNYGFNNMEVMAGTNYVEDYERNDWRRDYIQTPFQINGENIGVNLNLPYQQLDRMTPSKIFGQTSPLIKAIPELSSGKYAYTGMDINSVGEYIVNQISPLSKTLGLTRQEDALDTGLYLASQSGINFATIDNQLENQKELIDKYYPYVNSENVGFEDEGILEALIKKYRGVDE